MAGCGEEEGLDSLDLEGLRLGGAWADEGSG
jgi:hypothetical protein